jgi:hypothetical protein
MVNRKNQIMQQLDLQQEWHLLLQQIVVVAALAVSAI